MKRLTLLLSLCLLTVSVGAKIEIKKLEPTNWFVGMKDASLQLMAYGDNIRNAEVTIDYPNARIDSLVQLDSPNYLLIYLNLKDAQAGTMNINFRLGKQKTTDYERRRTQGFRQFRRALYAYARPLCQRQSKERHYKRYARPALQPQRTKS